jgi:predicted nucleic acid-binding protein
MADPVLVDTDILVDVARGVRQAGDFLADLAAGSDLAVSTVTEMELIVGCRTKAELAQLRTFLSDYRRVKLTPDISDRAVDLMTQFRLSHGLLIPDALIGATAAVSGHRLLTKNQKHYRQIPDVALVPYP